jgi:hypothetical protein
MISQPEDHSDAIAGPSSRQKNKGKKVHETTPLLPEYETDVRPNDPFLDEVSSTTSSSITNDGLWYLIKGVGAKTVAVLVLMCLFLFGLHLLRLSDLQEEIARSSKINIEQIELDSFTDDGVRVRVMGYTHMDYGEVQGSARSSFVKGAADMVRMVDVGIISVQLFLDRGEDSDPRYDRAANTSVPAMVVDIRSGHNTSFDFVTTLSDFGSPLVMSTIVEKILANGEMRFKAVAQIPVQKWGFELTVATVALDEVLNPPHDGNGQMNFDVGDIYITPNSNIGLDISTKLTAAYDLGVALVIPALNWNLEVQGCGESDDEADMILVSEGRTSSLELVPHSLMSISVTTSLSELPISLTRSCDNSTRSPLDSFITRYLSGHPNRVIIEGSESQEDDIPPWLAGLVRSVHFGFVFDGKRDGDDLIDDLEFRDFKLQLRQIPRASANVRVKIRLPELIDIDDTVPLEVSYTRGIADLFSDGELFAHLDIDQWIPCTTSPGDEKDTYFIQFALDAVPVQVTDQSVFGRVMREVIIAGSSPIRVEAVVDAQLDTPLGEFVLSGLPAAGNTVLRPG